MSAVAGAGLGASAKQDRFAAGQFFTRSEDEQLTMPAFEEFDCGVTVESAGVRPSPTDRPVTMMYEDKTIRGAAQNGGLRFRLFEDDWVHLAVGHGAVARSAVHAGRAAYVATNPPPLGPVDDAAQRPVAIDTLSRAVVSVPGVDGARTHAEAAHALAAAVAADPGLRGSITLAAAWELRP